jgi:hypothetical protein
VGHTEGCPLSCLTQPSNCFTIPFPTAGWMLRSPTFGHMEPSLRWFVVPQILQNKEGAPPDTLSSSLAGWDPTNL